MIDTKVIHEKLKVFLADKGYHLYHVACSKDKNDLILHVEIDDHLDLNGISDVSKLVSEFMDAEDFFSDPYLLDVSTVGLERVLYGHEDILNAKGQYVYVKFKKDINGLKNLYGTIKEVDDAMIVLDYKDKNIKKTIQFEQSNIKMIRLAIKF